MVYDYLPSGSNVAVIYSFFKLAIYQRHILSHLDLLAYLACLDVVFSQQKVAFGFVDLTDEFVSAISDPVNVLVVNFLSDVFQDSWTDVFEAEITFVDNLSEVLSEEYPPNLFV